MTAWNGEEDRFITHDKDTWEGQPKQKKEELICGLDIPSADWLEGFCTAMLSASILVDKECYPTMLGDFLRSKTEEIRNAWEQKYGDPGFTL